MTHMFSFNLQTDTFTGLKTPLNLKQWVWLLVRKNATYTLFFRGSQVLGRVSDVFFVQVSNWPTALYLEIHHMYIFSRLITTLLYFLSVYLFGFHLGPFPQRPLPNCQLSLAVYNLLYFIHWIFFYVKVYTSFFIWRIFWGFSIHFSNCSACFFFKGFWSFNFFFNHLKHCFEISFRFFNEFEFFGGKVLHEMPPMSHLWPVFLYCL